MSDLISKISASGLSAGVFLVWWPAHVTSQGGDVVLARGVLWAAAFELLLLGFRPLERAIGRAVRERSPPSSPRAGSAASSSSPSSRPPRRPSSCPAARTRPPLPA